MMNSLINAYIINCDAMEKAKQVYINMQNAALRPIDAPTIPSVANSEWNRRRNELLTSAPPSSSSNASKIADAIKRRRREQQQQDRDLEASQHQLEEGCDDNAVVEPLREQRLSPRVTADMAKSLQEEIQQQLYQPTLSPQKKSSSATPPTTSGSAALSAPSEPSVSPPRTTMTGTTTDAASSSSSSTLPPSSAAAAEPLSTPPPPPLWMEEELLQAPKIVRRHANGTWTDVGI
jgi:hypothetical protein